MSDTTRWTPPGPPRRQQQSQGGGGGDGANLADILERVLDKGIVIAGDIQVNLLDIELLTIKIRLVVASVDRAKEMGIDWWERDPSLSAGRRELEDENRDLRARVEALERGGRELNGDRPDDSGDDEPDDGFDEDAPDDVDDALEDAEQAVGTEPDVVDEDVDEAEDVEPDDETERPAPTRRRSGKRSGTRSGGAARRR